MNNNFHTNHRNVEAAMVAVKVNDAKNNNNISDSNNNSLALINVHLTIHGPTFLSEVRVSERGVHRKVSLLYRTPARVDTLLSNFLYLNTLGFLWEFLG